MRLRETNGARQCAVIACCRALPQSMNLDLATRNLPANLIVLALVARNHRRTKSNARCSSYILYLGKYIPLDFSQDARSPWGYDTLFLPLAGYQVVKRYKACQRYVFPYHRAYPCRNRPACAIPLDDKCSERNHAQQPSPTSGSNPNLREPVLHSAIRCGRHPNS